MEKEYNFEDYIVKSILANNSFNISTVSKIESLNSLYFHSNEYSAIENLIKKKDIDSLKELSYDKSESAGFLDILLLSDQSHRSYIVTIYDSNTLEQDPQVIEIYPL